MKRGAGRHRGMRLALLCTAVWLAAGPSGGFAQEEPVDPRAKEVIEAALEKYWERMSGIDNFLLVQETAGFETRSFLVKRTVDGRPVFVQGEEHEADETPSDPYAVFPRLASRARLVGSEEVDGHTCYVLEIDDLSGVDFGGLGPEDDSAFTPRRSTLHLDEELLVLRRMRMEGDLERDGETHPIAVVADLQDFRDVDGMLYPFRSVVTTQGFGAAISDEERAQARRNLEMLRARLDSMPEAQRRMLENALEGRMESLEQALGAGGLEIVRVVKELRVNVEPPDGG